MSNSSMHVRAGCDRASAGHTSLFSGRVVAHSAHYAGRAARPCQLRVHAPAVPAPELEESLSEKLAAWRRRRKLRNLYDLNLYGRGSLNEPLIRSLLALKVWHDVVDDGLGAKPFDPAEIVADIDARGCPRRTSAFSPSPSTRWHGSPASDPGTHSSPCSTRSRSGSPAAIRATATRSRSSLPRCVRRGNRDSSPRRPRSPVSTTWLGTTSSLVDPASRDESCGVRRS